MTQPQESTGKKPETVRVWMLGGFRFSVGSRAIEEKRWRLKKAAALVKLLALSPGHHLHREQAMELLWPDSGRKLASNNLRHALHAARKALDPEQGSRYLVSQDELLSLCPERGLWVDVEAFEGAARAAHRTKEPSAYEAALDLYAGELLPQDRYEGWGEERRRELLETYISLLTGLASAHERRGDYGSAIGVLRKVTREEPANEDAHVGLMRLYALSRRKAEALRHYDLLEKTISRQVETGPSASTRALREEIASGRFPPEVTGPLVSPSKEVSEPPRHNLPVSRTSFVGRGRELTEIKQDLAMTRLLTLVGVGGCGKTRLALRVATDLAALYPDGVWLVELASLSDPELVPQAVAEALGVREQPGRPLVESVADYLRGEKALLVLDNCEHLVDAVAHLVDFLLTSCPPLKVLATSREPLGVEGEVLVSVAPLSVPTGLPTETSEIGSYDSVRLFVERTRMRLPGFSLTQENATAAAEVCKRLEGIPLAIELAAARMGMLATEQVAQRLEDSLGLLSAGPRTASPRQRTMRAAIGWSHGLLSAREKEMFGRLSVFAGGFTLEAAEAVCLGGAIEESEVLDLLSGLVNKSLVVAEASGEGRVRYRMLEPVRQYAQEKLQEGTDGEDALRRHAAFFLALAERAEPELKGARQEAWLERLEAEHDNFRAALSWALERSETELGLRLGAGLVEFWHLRVYHNEARRWLEGALSREGGSPPVRMKALQRASFLAWEQADYERAVELGEEGLTIARDLGDDATAAAILVTLGSVAMSRVNVGRASALLEEAVALWRASGDDWGLAHALYMLGLAAIVHRDHDRAIARYEESMELARKAGDEVGIMKARGLGSLTALIRGDHRQADALGKQTIEVSRRLGIGHYIASCLATFSASASIQGRLVRAVRLEAAADSFREAMSIPRMPVERYFYGRYVQAARTQLDEEAWETAWSEGRAMNMEEAIEYALSGEDDGPSTPPAPEESVGAGPASLTHREMEVATFVASGFTNRRIAAELCISEHTVANHVARIRRKLGLNSRSQLSAWVMKEQSLS